MTDSFAVGFYTHSLALIADAFHYVLFTQENLVDKTINKFAQLNDLVGFVVAFAAFKVRASISPPNSPS